MPLLSLTVQKFACNVLLILMTEYNYNRHSKRSFLQVCPVAQLFSKVSPSNTQTAIIRIITCVNKTIISSHIKEIGLGDFCIYVCSAHARTIGLKRTNCAWNVYRAKWDVYNKGEVYPVLFDLFCSDKGLYILEVFTNQTASNYVL